MKCKHEWEEETLENNLVIEICKKCGVDNDF